MTRNGARLEAVPPRLLYIHMAALGDAIMASPALRLLKEGLPRWQIEVLARGQAVEYFSGLSCVDRVIRFVDERYVERRRPWRLLQGWTDLRRLFRELRGARYSAVVQWRGQLPDTLMSVVTRARHRVAGVQSIHRRSLFPVERMGFLVTDLVPVTNPHSHMVEAMVAPARYLVGKLGGTVPEISNLPLEYPLQPADHAEAEAFLHAHGISPERPFAMVSLSAKTAVNTWPNDRFAQVADHLQRRHGLAVVLTGIPEHLDREAAVAGTMRTPAIRTVGRLRFGPVCAALARCSLLVSLNTGISHIAAALRIPVVVLSGRDGASISPWRTRHRVVTRNSFYPQRHPHERDWATLVPLISVGDVTGAVDELMADMRQP